MNEFVTPLCKQGEGSHREQWPLMLLFVLPGAKKNLFDRWKTDSAFQHRRLIAIDYDEAVHEAVQALCPMEITDLRDTPPYR